MDDISFENFSLEVMASDQTKAEEFADYLERRGLLAAPGNLKSSILERSRQADIRIIAGSNHLSKKSQLFRYSLKVSLAAACSIGIIIAMPGPCERYAVAPQVSRSVPIYVEAYEKIQEWGGKINQFSKSLLDLEVPLYDE